MTEFDIMLPHYGDTAMLKTAVRSVLAQTVADWRLVVVDDDGRDTSLPGWFKELDDPRVEYLPNETNLGITRNFNRCVDLAEAPYLVMMGCDDVMLPDYLAVVRGVRERHPGVEIVQPGVQAIDSDGRPAVTSTDRIKRMLRPGPGGESALQSGEPLAASLLRGNWLYFPSLCWRTESVRAVRFREDLSVIQDLALVMELLVRGATLALTPEVCFQYRRHAVSVSSARAVSGARFTEERRFFTETAEQLRSHGWTKAATAAERHFSSRAHALTLVPAALRSGQKGTAGNLLRHALR
ncbi:glycosyltransferase [Streptomyces sp. H10-C2]|uniref:glycosyltransferase family 2 protein n=1 Tax=unclassified Streptomyces TaxID=2593676 RepID=UPI0024BAF280|nr:MULTISPECIES: glycosyltransferase family 2 protein [unclassified Streptomyces]MDJ0342459.1 glycosyltransferase [Streptomyces sp. PH10-H1]MDJ0372314.1 glycosyltransferase [Streptomyces sp. H10-C2]